MNARSCLVVLGAVAYLAIIGPAHADSFSFGDYYFPGQTLPNGFSSTTDGGGPYSASGPGAGFTVMSEGHGWNGQFAHDVTLIYDNGIPGAISIGFAEPVDSITGLSAQPALAGAYVATMWVYDAAGLVGSSSYSSVNGPGPEGSIPMFSFAHPGITEIVVETTNDGQGFALGGGAGIPEPAAWAMMLIGCAGLGLLARRRRHGHANAY